MSRDLRSDEVEQQQEDNLLLEAVSLLVQRHRETESWLADQMAQGERRAAATERRYADLEARLTGIEDQLERLARELGADRPGAAAGDRLARLREQLDDLKSEGDVRQVRPVPAPTAVAAQSVATAPTPVSSTLSVAPPAPTLLPTASRASEPEARPAASEATSQPAEAPAPSPSPAPPVVAASSGQLTSFLETLGPRPQDRWGVVLIGIGMIAVLFAILTQLRIG